MGLYNIDGKYIFHEERKELKKIEGAFIIKLTAMRAKCLSYMIEHAQQDVIERSELSEALWGSRSKFASDASLTQVLYLIRRDMKILGVDDFFITIPKSGIKVNTTISITKIINKEKKKTYFLRKAII